MTKRSLDSFNTLSTLKVGRKTFSYHSLSALSKKGFDLSRLPFSMRVFLENLLRREDGASVKKADIEAVARFDGKAGVGREVFFMPARVLMQDFTGVPAVVDLAAMRDAIKAMGGDPQRINPLVPVDLVVDHSVQVDFFGAPDAFQRNAEIEFQRNRERYAFLKWGQKAFRDFRAVPPETGIVHQVNLEYLAKVVWTAEQDGQTLAYPDTLVGTDSHTTMINGLGVVGWGVGGIEAEAAMLGQSLSMLVPEVIGFKLTGKLAEGATATDLVLTVTEMLRKKGVVGKFVEFYGAGVGALSLADRATLGNMAPEYGATIGFFPVDARTLDYLHLTGRPEEEIALVEAYCKEQGLFRTDKSPEPVFSSTLELDLGEVEPSLAGPKRPQDRIALSHAKAAWESALPAFLKEKDKKGNTPAPAGTKVNVKTAGASFDVEHGSVVIAAITSCTNTSNPSVLIGAGLLAKKAVAKGLSVKPWVKTSLAPGSKTVTDYLAAAGLTKPLEALKFHLVGYGCTTCIGNSGPLPEPIAEAVGGKNLVVAAVLSGNRNFEGRINPLVKANYLASPPLVVAYALAGRMDVDLKTEPLGQGKDGKPVFLKDIWPTNDEVAKAVEQNVHREMFQKSYADVFAGDQNWKSLDVALSDLYQWEDKSTYVRLPPYFESLKQLPRPLSELKGARALAVFGDSITTDHISPAGNIAKDSPAAKYLQDHGVKPADFNSYGARRGNHEVMMRGTFANIRIKNHMVDVSGGYTLGPDGRQTTIFEASQAFKAKKVPLIVLAGKEYGSGSSRDWAAKGPMLLGVSAVIAQSFERIHRSNLVGMGVLPLQFKEGESISSLGLTGRETFEISGIAQGFSPRKELTVTATGEGGKKTQFKALARIDTAIELEYFRYGGILPYVLVQMLSGKGEPVSAGR